MESSASVSSRALKCYTACYDGKLEEVKRIVEEDNDETLDVNAEIHGGTAFAAAVQNGHLDIIKYLVSCDADVDHPIHDGATPIFIAASGVRRSEAARARARRPTRGPFS